MLRTQFKVCVSIRGLLAVCLIGRSYLWYKLQQLEVVVAGHVVREIQRLPIAVVPWYAALQADDIHNNISKLKWLSLT
jgi:hypothetical protein